MGFFGPQGPLPLATTLEAHHWLSQRDDPAFARFADMFSNRFVQLFYRAWADARPIVQMGRPAEDRFRAWTGALIGVGTPGLAARDTLPDDARRQVLGLWGARVRSAARLMQILREIMAMDLDLDERVGSWLEFSPDDHSRLGGARAAIGRNCCLGARAWSVSHKIRVTLHCRDLDEYERCLPGRAECTRLGDLLRSYLGPPSSRRSRSPCRPTAAADAARAGRAARLDQLRPAAPRPRCPRMRRRHAARAQALRRLSGSARSPRQFRQKARKMTEISLETVAGKLNRLGYDAFMQALRHARGEGNRNVELAHWLHHLLANERSDMAVTLRHFGIDPGRVQADIDKTIAGFRKNVTEMPGISAQLTDALDRGWHYATLLFGEAQIRSGHALVAILRTRDLARALRDLSPLMATLDADQIVTDARTVWADSDEEDMRPMDGSGLGRGRRRCGRGGRARGADRARAVLHRHDRAGRERQDGPDRRAATRRSARSSTC